MTESEQRHSYDRRKPKSDPFTRWFMIVGLAIQLTLGAIAYGRLDGRLQGLEKNVELLMQRAISK